MTTDRSAASGDRQGLSKVLATALGRTASNQRAARGVLFRAISDCVADLRAKRVPREDVPEAIRVVVHGARHAPGALPATPTALDPALERLIEQCVLWHYGEDGRGT
jgi:hypothetical protein